MVAPAVTTRTAPVGIPLENGYQILIAFSQDVDVSLWEKSVKPPGLDGGDPIDITTQWNETYRTQAARSLIKMTDGGMTVGYDPAVYPQIAAIINKEGAITINLPDGSSLSFYGALRTFEPNDQNDGTMPEATCAITVTNRDPTTGDEEAPVYTAPVGGGGTFMNPLGDNESDEFKDVTPEEALEKAQSMAESHGGEFVKSYLKRFSENQSRQRDITAGTGQGKVGKSIPMTRPPRKGFRRATTSAKPVANTGTVSQESSNPTGTTGTANPNTSSQESVTV